MRTLIAAGILLALAGCAANPPSRNYVLWNDKMDEATQLSRYRDVLDSDDIALLDGKVNLKETYYRQAPACEHIKADAYPTPAESAALSRWNLVRAAYFKQFYDLETKSAAVSDKVAPLAQRYVDALKHDLDHSTLLIGELAAGKMTYCEFAAKQKAAILASHDQVQPLRLEMIAAMRAENYGSPTGIALGFGGATGAYGAAGSSGPGSIGH